MNKKYFLQDRNFINAMLAIALPLSVQFLISTSINMADTVMITSLGGAEIAAVGLVNQLLFFFMVAGFGICSAGAVFFAQHFGNKDLHNVRKYLTITLQLNVALSIFFTFASLIFTEQIMKLLSPEADVVALGVAYLRIVALTFIIVAVSQSFNTVLRSCNRPKDIMKVAIVSLFTNIIFNYIFIFGKLGLPAMGVAGAAYGTVIARFLEFIILIILIYKPKKGREHLAPVDLLKIHTQELKGFFVIALPIIMAEALWSFGQLLFSVAYARIGKDATASIQLTGTIQNIFFILVNAINSAAAVLIGQSLGAFKKDRAQVQARYFLQISVVIGIISSLVLCLLPDVLMLIYGNVEDHIYQTARNLLIIRGLFITFRFLNGMIFVGIFRAGGETRTPFIIESITMWGFAIPMSFIGVLVFKWPIEWIFTIVSLEEFIKVFLVYPLYRKKRWLNNIT